MILTHSDICAGIVDRSSLAYNNIAGLDDLATEFLESKTLAL